MIGPEDLEGPEVDPDEPIWRTPATIGDEPVHRAEIVLSVILRIGVATSLILVLWGLVLTLVVHREGFPGGIFVSPEAGIYPTSLRAIVAGVLAGQPRAFIALGLLVLIVTPVVNVALSAVAFAVEQDWAFVVIAGAIILFLLAGLLLNAAVS